MANAANKDSESLRARLPVFKTIRDIEAFESIPIEERLGVQNTYDFLQQGAAIDPERVALHFLPQGRADDEPETYRYKDMIGRINQAANLFHDLGIGPRDVVSYLLPSLPETHFTVWGAEATGIVNPVNYLLEPAQIVEILNAAGTRCLVALGPSDGFDIWEKVTALRGDVPSLQTILQVRGAGEERDGVLDFNQQVEPYPADRLVSGRSIAPDEPTGYFHTGGTTSAPKLVIQTHLNQVYDVWIRGLRTKMTAADTLMSAIPLFHANGFIVTTILPLTVGATIVLAGPSGFRNPDLVKDFWKIVERYRVTTFSAVPTMYSTLLNVPIDGADVSSLRFAACGAAPMPVEVFKSFERQTGLMIIEGYGLTEGTASSSNNPIDGERRVGSVGLRHPYQEIKPVKLDDNGAYVRDCEVGEVGVIAMRGPHLFPGYKQEEYIRTAWLAEGWFNTGDLGYYDEDSYLWLTGRAKDLIIRGGHNIDPSVIEETLHQHPGVALAAAVGQPDPHAGELPVAYVELKRDADTSGDELKAFARENISERAAVPVAVWVIETMPLTAVGKIYKPALRHNAIERVLEDALAPVAADSDTALTVSVNGDATTGTRATIRSRVAGKTQQAAIAERIKAALSPYALTYDVAWDEDEPPSASP